MAVDILFSTPTPTEWGGFANRTVVQVELLSTNAQVDPMIPHQALRTIEGMVRSNDWICPYAVKRIAIALGRDAEAVSSRQLAERLARSVEWGLFHSGSGASPWSRSTAQYAPSTTVTVDRPLSTPALRPQDLLGDGHGRRGDVRVCGYLAPRLRHRTVVEFPSGRSALYGSRHNDPDGPGGRPAASGTVLVVDPSPTGRPLPGLAASATYSLISRLGLRADVCSVAVDEQPVLELGGAVVDVVVVVVSGQPAGASAAEATWETSTWCLPARVVSAYRSVGIDVLAVGSGASAGALAGCTEAGASVFLDPEELPAALLYLRSSRGRPAAGTAAQISTGNDPCVATLVRLTTSERRVLFFLTQGRSAQDIADVLVVSLTTVRSHIRSILRKMGVRSQLAAVAIANGQGRPGDFCANMSPLGDPTELSDEGDANGQVD